jgi:hypothetical protein
MRLMVICPGLTNALRAWPCAELCIASLLAVLSFE